MEYLGEHTLDDLIQAEQKPSEFDILDIGIGIASGLNFALQQNNLIHRDIKPDNIMLNANGTPKILDFGLALVSQAPDHTKEIWGTPYYVSPERLEQKIEDFRSDIYSLGVSLYHLLCGHPPFDAQTADLTAAKHLEQPPLPIKTYVPSASEYTSYAIMKCLARKPEDRYQSYDELIEQFEDTKRRLFQQIEQKKILHKKRFGLFVIFIGLGTLAATSLVIWHYFANSP